MTANVTIVSGIRVRHDAISNIICHQRRVLAEAGHNVRVLIHHHDGEAFDWEAAVPSSWELLRHPGYLEADLVIFHFGIYYELFNALALPHPRGARRVVHFHNVTPPDLLHGPTRRSAQDGLIQLAVAERADVIWSDSLHNTEVLCDFTEIDRSAVVDMPPMVPAMGGRTSDGASNDGPVRLIAVGRFIAAKGLDDLVAALAELPPTVREGVRLTLAGSIANSDAAYLGRLVETIDGHDLTSIVDIVSDPNDDELVELFRRSDIFVSASHHEGFCVPAVEALAAGCRAIVTDAGALPDTVGPGGVIVPVYDVHALSAAIAAEAESVIRVRAGDPAAIARSAARDDLVAAHLVRFTPATSRDRILAATAAALDGRASHRAEAQ